MKILKIVSIFFLFHLFAFSASAAGYDFYVDAGSAQVQKDGSEQFPWKTVRAATDFIKNSKLKNKSVFVKNGEYKEAVALRNNTNLIGQDREKVVINGENESIGIFFDKTNSKIEKLTVKNANNNISVDKKSKAQVNNCELKGAGTAGIEVKKSSSRKSYQFILRDSTIADGDKYGIYISQRRIEITGNYVHGNEEEGLDLHDGINGKVSGNRFEDNGESGIEMILAGTSLNVTSNDIKNNKKQGIAIQAYSLKKGKISIARNTISENDKFGIEFVRFAKSSREKFVTFIKKNVKLSKNTLRNNGEGDFNYELQ